MVTWETTEGPFAAFFERDCVSRRAWQRVTLRVYGRLLGPLTPAEVDELSRVVGAVRELPPEEVFFAGKRPPPLGEGVAFEPARFRAGRWVVTVLGEEFADQPRGCLVFHVRAATGRGFSCLPETFVAFGRFLERGVMFVLCRHGYRRAAGTA